MRVLLVDPDPESAEPLRRACARGGHELRRAGSFEQAGSLLSQGAAELVCAALGAAPTEERRLELIKTCDRHRTALILLASSGEEAEALSPMEQRVIADFAVKPLDPVSLAARMEAVRRRREERSRERALLDAMPDMMFRLRGDGTYVDYHVPRGELLYAPPEEFLGRRVEEMMPPELVEMSRNAISRALENGSHTFQYELSLDEGVHQFEARMVRSAPNEVLTIVRNVTEQQRTVAALAKSERTMRALLDAMPDTMFRSRGDGTLLDLITHDRGLDKETHEHILGKSKEEIVAAIPGLDSELAEAIYQCLLQALETGELQTIRYEFDHNGSHTHHEARLAPCGHNEVLGIIRDITDIKRAEEELRSVARVKQAFANRVLDVQESERQHLARELHDVIGQRLLVHRMDVEWMAARGDEQLARAAEELCGSLDETLQMIRSLAQGLRPPALDDLGIGSALETLASEISRRSGIDCECRIEETAANLPAPIAVAIYRIAQEALANAVRHSGCRRVLLSLGQPNGSIELQVKDDGSGIPPHRIGATESLGLMGMRERAELLGGNVRIEAAGGTGTLVMAEIPQTSHRIEEAG